jgi:hypothetical protein
VCENPECAIIDVTWTIKEHYLNMISNLYRRELKAVDEKESNIREIKKLKEQIKQLKEENKNLTRRKNSAKLQLKKMYAKELYGNHDLEEYRDSMFFELRRY